MKLFRTTIPKIIFIIILVWLSILAYRQSLFGMVGLGLLLIVSGGWILVKAPAIWVGYKKAYQHLSKKQRSSWNQPKIIYYYINRLVIAPLFIVLGLAIIYVAIKLVR